MLKEVDSKSVSNLPKFLRLDPDSDRGIASRVESVKTKANVYGIEVGLLELIRRPVIGEQLMRDTLYSLFDAAIDVHRLLFGADAIKGRYKLLLLSDTAFHDLYRYSRHPIAYFEDRNKLEASPDIRKALFKLVPEMDSFDGFVVVNSMDLFNTTRHYTRLINGNAHGGLDPEAIKIGVFSILAHEAFHALQYEFGVHKAQPPPGLGTVYKTFYEGSAKFFEDFVLVRLAPNIKLAKAYEVVVNDDGNPDFFRGLRNLSYLADLYESGNMGALVSQLKRAAKNFTEADHIDHYLIGEVFCAALYLTQNMDFKGTIPVLLSVAKDYGLRYFYEALDALWDKYG
jgi:hypothetical protein